MTILEAFLEAVTHFLDTNICRQKRLTFTVHYTENRIVTSFYKLHHNLICYSESMQENKNLLLST